MADMIDEEYDILNDRWTKTSQNIDFAQLDILTRQRALLKVLDKDAANYIIAQAEATNQTPAQVISKIIQQEIAAGK